MKILVVAHHEDPLAYSIGQAFQQSFVSLGHESIVQSCYESGYDLCLVFYAWAHHNFPKDSTYKIAYNWECLLSHRWHTKVRRALKQFDCLFECSETNLGVNLPIKHLYCPIGYHSSFELESGSCSQKYAVSLLGRMDSRHRVEIIQRIEEKCQIKVWCARSQEEQIHSQSRGMNLGDLIHNTSIHLNIHRDLSYPMFESIRVIAMLLSNGSFVISEHSTTSPLVHNRHYVETNDLPGTVKYYLEHSEERKQIAQCGYNFIKTHYKLIDFLAECLKKI